MTPPGVAPWSFQYTTTPDDSGSGRLRSVSRSATGLPTETTTMAYGVPLSGSAAPYQMTPQDVANWGQADDPTDATAIFPANHVPANPPASFTPAAVLYMNAKGQQVNLASPGGRITTTEHDANNGQVVRQLGPANPSTRPAELRSTFALTTAGHRERLQPRRSPTSEDNRTTPHGRAGERLHRPSQGPDRHDLRRGLPRGLHVQSPHHQDRRRLHPFDQYVHRPTRHLAPLRR